MHIAHPQIRSPKYEPQMFLGIHSFIQAISSNPLILRGVPDTAWKLCRSFTLKRHRQLRVKDLSKVPTWQLEWGFEPTTLRSKGFDSTNAPCHPTTQSLNIMKIYKDN